MPMDVPADPGVSTGLPLPLVSKLQVCVETLPLDLSAEALRGLAGTLSVDEHARASRFKFDRDRNRFIAARGQLRIALGRCSGADASRIEFAYGPRGKPALAGDFAAAGLHFNLSHSEDLALLGVTTAGPVGVDLERVRRLPEFDLLVSRFFSARERVGFLALPADQKPTAFFKLWTRKEAWLKATGEGISEALGQVEVTFLPAQPAQLLSLPDGTQDVNDWSLHEVVVPAGFVAAVAVRGAAVQLYPFPGRNDTTVAPHPPYSG